MNIKNEELKNEELKSYEPSYEHECCVCGQKPVVTLVNEKREILYSTDMCGPCTWGEAETVVLETWN